MQHVENLNEVSALKEKIKNNSALYYYRSTPFTEHGEFNYNGALTEDFFFKNMFSSIGECNSYIDEIQKVLNEKKYKSILLIGNQGCGKTTFMHYLTRQCNNVTFEFFDFDKNTSNPKLAEYVEKLSTHLHNLLKSDDEVNKLFLDLYIRNKDLINTKINANNNINQFFENFKKIYVIKFFKSTTNSKENFIKNINSLFFNQILSLIILWYICKFKRDFNLNKNITPIVFCLDNLDVLINKEIIDKFFKEYFLFVRNVDSIIQNINDSFITDNDINYNSLFSFIFCCRQHTWARFRQHYRHGNPFVRVSTFELNITDAFEKKEILSQREKYIVDNYEYYKEFKKKVTDIKQILADMDAPEGYSHNIYDLFDDDYRQCNITFEELIDENPDLINEYFEAKQKFNGISFYGARGIIYKAIFDKFKKEGIFDQIGVLQVNSKTPLVSNARMILNYLNYHTFTSNKQSQKTIPFKKLVEDFSEVISKDDIDKSLIAMFKLGDDSYWNELIAFAEINSESLDTCDGLDVFITKAGHEYLSLMATHFEFFNSRVTKRRSTDTALFSNTGIQKSKNDKYKYNFQETIQNVIDIVEECCSKMSKLYKDTNWFGFKDKSKYLQSFFVYGDAKVLHGERIIHTHIRYLDYYRFFILNNADDNIDKEGMNRLLVDYIEKYINIGEENPDILTEKSTSKLFPAFKEKIDIIKKSNYQDYKTRIDI